MLARTTEQAHRQMRVLITIAGALLVALMVSEFFVTFMLPRRVRRDPLMARGAKASRISGGSCGGRAP